jgi:hypothetical protein
MLNRILASIVLLAYISAPSYAFSSLLKEKSHKKNKITATYQSKKNNESEEDYTDFSGQWTGSCDWDEPGDTFSITIKNDAHIFFFDDMKHFYVMHDHLKTSSDSTSGSTDYDHKTVFWNPDKTKLITNELYASNHHNREVNIQTPIDYYFAKEEFSLNNGKLIVRVEEIAYTELEKTRHTTTICTFDKDENVRFQK